jgi:ribonucleoside-triphosphate reductase
MYQPSVRAEVITRRTYNRPLNDEGTLFETWEQTVDRVIDHQHWLWKRALRRPLSQRQQNELTELRDLLLDRKVGVSGRTLWLGGTDIAKRREASQFNCAYTVIETINDTVDALWLLLQGCGIGFSAKVGLLSGFSKPIHDIEVIRSTMTIEQWEAGERGRETNLETFDNETKVWTISVGDSAEAWAKSVGKILAGKHYAEKLVLDFSQIRPSGIRLKGYGWISSGDQTISIAYQAIAKIMSRRAGQLLRKMDIHDIINWLGTILSTRRSSEISLVDYGTPEWEEFASAKDSMYDRGLAHREQSNNSLVFYQRPDRPTLERIFEIMQKGGGSEPGFINGEAALRRAPWFAGVNPCGEILLPNKGFCNLVTVDLAKFPDDPAGLHRAIQIMARANYRQTLVDLNDGILQASWHHANSYLRLCGVSLTGQVRRPDLTDYDYRTLKNLAIQGAYSMADELGTQRPKLVTTVKPEGTGSKIMDTTEGIHKPLGRYILNNVVFGGHDPLVEKLKAANYQMIDHPTRPGDVIVALPVAWNEVEFERVGGIDVNLEPAVSQLERYKRIMDTYVEHNCSITVSYDPSEVPAMIDWLLANWGSYVGVSFLPRVDPTKKASDFGYLYLPQEVITKMDFDTYVSKLLPVNLNDDRGDEITLEDCATGACPIK